MIWRLSMIGCCLLALKVSIQMHSPFLISFCLAGIVGNLIVVGIDFRARRRPRYPVYQAQSGYPAQSASWSSASAGTSRVTHVAVYDAREPIDDDDSWMDEEEDF